MAEIAHTLRADPRPLEEALPGVLVETFGFLGAAAEAYEAPESADIPSVLASRRGLPVALAIIWRIAARAIGAPFAITSTPGHVLGRLQTEEGPVIFDPFNPGRRLDDRALYQIAVRAGLEEAPALAFAPATDRAAAIRLQTNLWSRARAAGGWEAAERAAHRRALLGPQTASFHLDHAEALAGLEAFAGARAALDRLEELPAEPALRTEAARLRAAVSRRLN